MNEKKFQALSKPQQELVIKIASEAERQGVNPELAIAIAEAETGGKYAHYGKDGVLTSPSGAKGVMQIMPDTARLYNKNLGAEIDPDDEDSNIRGGIFILKDLLTKYKSPRIAVAMYNASPKANADFVEKYKTDPDAAIMSLKPETHKYSLRISQNFNLDDDNETGLIAAPKADPFAGYESESAKLKQEQDAQAEADKNKPPPPKTLLDRASESANELDPAKAAVVGAGANALFPMFTNPQVSPKVDASKAIEANLSAQDKLELARRNLENAVPQGMYDLEDTYRQSQGELERLKNEQRLAQERLRGLPKAPPEINMPSADAAPTAADAPSRTKAGDPGAVNWVHSMAEGVPEVVADQALNMRADNPRGGQAIIDRDMAARQRQEALGLGDYGLVRTEGGVQLALPPTSVAERQAEIERQNQENQAEIERKSAQARIQQETQAWYLEQQRAAHEAELERLRQERSAAGQRHNVITGQTKTAAPLQRALTKAETDAEIASRRLARANQQPNAAGRVLEGSGVGSTKIGAIPRTVVGGLAGYAGVMSYQEALERFKAGDTSEGVLKALEAGSAAAMLTPPAGKKLTKVRGAGTLGGLTLGAYELGKQLLKDRPQDEK